MKTDVEVTISGLPFNQKAVTGVTFCYGINSIPVASIALDATAIQQTNPEFLCNPDKFKKRDHLALIQVKSKTGCIKFEGYFDGLSISQSVGSIQYTAIVKSKFTRLAEIYPRMVGVMPGSFSIYRSAEQLFTDQDDPENPFPKLVVGNKLFLDTGQSIGEYLLTYLKAIIESQFNFQKFTNTTPDTVALFQTMQSEIFKKNLQEAIPLLNKVDISYVNKCTITGRLTADIIAALTLGEHASLWDLMINAYNFLGCCLLVGNDGITIVPQAAFLKFQHDVPAPKAASHKINAANPADYNSYAISNTGFNNIRYCHVVIDASGLPEQAKRSAARLANSMGVYPTKAQEGETPDDGSSGILVVKASPFLLTGLTFGVTGNADMQQRIKANQPYFKVPVETPDTERQKKEKQNQETLAKQAAIDDHLNAYAKLKFMQMKYSDRVGQLSLYFNPKWVPATTGSLYSRLPGLFVQFYVTSVIHTIQMAAPSSGTATTNVSFSSVRMGAKANNIYSIAKEDLFNYTEADMLGLQNKWVKDVSK